MDYSDYYSFNGQRLILKSGEYGKDGAEYVTEKYSNIKIKSVGAYNINGQDAGPAHFEVTFEDGSQAWYGLYNPGSTNVPVTTPMEYNIVKWKDTQGNYITYKYTSESSSGGFRKLDTVVRISSIEWGGNESLNKPHFNLIEFIYNDRGLIEESYVQGLKHTQSKILSEIKVNSNGSQFKRYAINYIKTEQTINLLIKLQNIIQQMKQQIRLLLPMNPIRQQPISLIKIPDMMIFMEVILLQEISMVMGNWIS